MERIDGSKTSENVRRGGEFQVDDRRLERFLEQDFTRLGQYKIPIGKNSSVTFKHRLDCGYNLRTLGEVLSQMAPDEYDDSCRGIAHLRRLVEEEGVLKRDLLKFGFGRMPEKDVGRPVFGGISKLLAGGGVRVLDVGCGMGIAGMKAARDNPELSWVGFDEAIAERRRIVPDEPGLQLTCGDWGEKFPVAANSVDLTLASNSFLCWEDDLAKLGRAVAETDRVTKAGGQVRMVDGGIGGNDPVYLALRERKYRRVMEMFAERGWKIGEWKLKQDEGSVLTLLIGYKGDAKVFDESAGMGDY
jgi:SAM-dependent methyltransferase